MSQKGMTVQDVLNVINTADVITTWPYESRASSGDQIVMVFLDSDGRVSHLSTDFIEGIGLNRVPVKNGIKDLLLRTIQARKYQLYGLTNNSVSVKTR